MQAFMTSGNLSSPQRALHEIALWLRDQGYDFVTVTPETHRRVRAQRGDMLAKTLRDVFGWNMSFSSELLPPEILTRLHQAHAITMLEGSNNQSRIRFACFDGLPYVHSAYPTTESDAVFCGPDTFRFVSLVRREIQRCPNVSRIVDVGCGAGAGGLLAARWTERLTGRAPHIQLVDVNSRALEMAKVNAATFGCTNVAVQLSDLYSQIHCEVDLIVANPPYLVDDNERLYRHGGGRFGSALSERIVKEGLPLLAPKGRLVLYTGSAIEDGKDAFKEAALRYVDYSHYDVAYRELDPDVFGEELDRTVYHGVERIAAVELVITRN
jgi:methylase of polypeptide subunit release factors